jgi:hypothetical protein
MPSQDENQQPTSPKTLGEILDAFPLPANSILTSNENKVGSSITTSPKGKPEQTGRHLSEHGLESLRNIARNVSRGNLMDDQALETLLVQLLGSSRFASKQKLKHIYADGSYDCEIDGYDISLDRLDDAEMTIMDAVEYFNKPASSEFVAKQIGRLQAVMARRSESNADIAVVLDTYTDHLEKYPPDIVKSVCDRVMETQKWFPQIVDLIKELEVLMKFRRALLNACNLARNPLLSSRTKALPADPRLGIHWRSLPMKDWVPQHYQWWIEDAEEMVALAAANPSAFKIDWQAELAYRRAEAEKAAA